MEIQKIKGAGWFLIAMLLIVSVHAIPMPMGVDGKIYGLTGESANSDVRISVLNMNNSYYAEGKVRKDGTYSFAITGELEDLLKITAWTNYSKSDRNLTLQGVIHNVNLVLNLSYPDFVISDENNGVREDDFKSQDDAVVAKIGKYRRRPYVVTGEIEAEGIVEYEITNLDTGDKITGESDGPAYAEIVDANKGDRIEVTMKNQGKNQTKVSPITGAVVRSDFDLQNSFLKQYIYLIIAFIGFVAMVALLIKGHKK